MSRFCNTAAPCVSGAHYLPAVSERCCDVVDLIARKQYLVIHAARQSGMRTSLPDLRHTPEAQGNDRNWSNA